MNELVPKADSGSREAQLDKKREIGARMHGAAKAAEESRDGLGMDDSTMYGGGNDDFKVCVVVWCVAELIGDAAAGSCSEGRMAR